MKINGRKFAADLYSSWARGTDLYVKLAASQGINYYEMMVFYALDANKDLTQKEISHDFGMPKQTINNVIRSLKKEGYIILGTSETDKREKNIVLTESGRAYSEKALESLYRIEERVCRDIGPERLSQMIETSELFNVLFEKEAERNR